MQFWILETFPTSVQFWSVDSSKIPRGLAWSKFKELQKKHYPLLFDPVSIEIIYLLYLLIKQFISYPVM